MSSSSSSSSLGNLDDQAKLTRQISAYCGIQLGLMYTDGKLSWSHAPIAAFPSSFPRQQFRMLQELQPVINILVDRITRDRDFLISSHADVRKHDAFTDRLLKIYESIPASKINVGQVQLGIHRSDYMMNVNPADDSEHPLQIEINTIASSFGCLSKKVGELHRHVLSRHMKEEYFNDIITSANLPYNMEYGLNNIPDNASQRMHAFALALAHVVYGDNQAIVIFIVQPHERNIADQRLLEHELWQVHGIAVEFMTLAEAHERCMIDHEGNLKYQSTSHPTISKTVSVVYYRAGYSPNDYPSEVEWDARSMIESSSAIKCPSIGYQLAGTKKIQQSLCEAGVLERFLGQDGEQFIPSLRQYFAEQYSLTNIDGNPATKQAVDAAIADGSEWVLKPQREGGGNNLYGSNLSEFLIKHRHDHLLGGYILMQRIFPKPQNSILIRNEQMTVASCINEIGIYGVFLGDGSETTLVNREAGYLVRTKAVGVDEGGVATGYSVLNSLVLLGEDTGDHRIDTDDDTY